MKYGLLLRFTGLTIVSISVLVLVGWVLNVPFLVTLKPGLPTMKVNTSIAFAMCGLALYLMPGVGKRSNRVLYRLLAIGIIAIAATTLAEYITGIDLGIDQLLWRDTVTDMRGYPGRMAISSAFNFTLLGICLLTITSTNNVVQALTQYALHLVSTVSGLPLLGYLFNSPVLYSIPFYGSMALHTALLFLVTSVLLAFKNNTHGFTGVFMGRGIGNSMARWLFPLLMVAAVALAYTRMLIHKWTQLPFEVGTAILTIAALYVVFFMIRHTAIRLNKIEEQKKATERALSSLNAEIEAAKKAERTFKEINMRNQAFIAQSPSAIAMFDTDMRYLAASEQWIKDYNLTGKKIIGESHYDVFPEIGDDWKAIHANCLKGAVNKNEAGYFKRADGTEQWIAWDVRPWYITPGKVGGLLIYTADISPLKLKEREIREINYSLAEAQKIAHVGSWSYDVLTGKTTWSDELYRILGYALDTTPAIDLFLQVVHADDREMVKSAMAITDKCNGSYNVQCRIERADGALCYVEVRGEMICNEAGEVMKVLGTMADITSLKTTKEQLRKLNDELTSILNAETHVSIISTNLNGVITHFSKGAEILLGYTAAEMVGVQTPAVIHDFREILSRGSELSQKLGRQIRGFDVLVEYARLGKDESREWTYIRKDGSHFPVQLVVSALRDAAGKITGFLGIATDITERKKYEHAERSHAILQMRYKEMEEFSYIASHDLQEPLKTVTSFVDLLEKDYSNKLNGAGEDYLRFIKDSTTRMRTLINGLLDYSRLGKQKNMGEVNCNEMILQVTQDLNAMLLETGAEITWDELPVVKAFSTELKQLFQNLISNAVKFRKKNEIPRVHISVQKTNNHWQFKVSDNGIGIDKKYFNKIFILFQRLHNRDQYEGTGIGLSYCKKIVELHHGQIWVESTPGVGSNFYFTIQASN